MIGLIGFGLFGLTAIGVLLCSIKIIRPISRGVVERLGKYNRFCEPGIHFVIPVIERLVIVNTTERLIDAQRQDVITKDNLNTAVDAQVYFKVKATEQGLKNALYNVDNFKNQIFNLARTTLRDILGKKTLTEANSKRDAINDELMAILEKETKEWGIEVIRTEIKEIEPPRDVQEAMNEVVKAENEKIAAVNHAMAVETRADGARRAKVKEAMGLKRHDVLKAEGKSQAIKLVNEAAEKYFVGNAQLLKKLETVENTLKHSTKIIVPSGVPLTNVICDQAGVKVIPITSGDKREKRRKLT